MDSSNQTRSTLILRLQEGNDNEAWAEFVEIYTPVVYGLAKRQRLQDADASDVTQEVFRTVAKSIQGFRFRPSNGSFRGWLYTVTRSRLNDLHSRNAKHVMGSGDTAVNERLADEPDNWDWDEACEQEYRHSLFRWATRRIHGQFSDSTWAAFWQTSVDGKSVRETASNLAMSEGAVYVARSRVLARLRERIREVEEA